MIIGIEGGLGSGKTILMVRYLKKDSDNNNKIYCNFGLKHIDYNSLNLLEILEMDKNKFNLNDVSIGIDEMTVFADCRKSGSKLNRMISYFILQSRKRNTNIYYTTQDLSMVDFRLVNYTDIQILADNIYDKKGNVIPDYKRYTIFDMRDIRRIEPIRNIINISHYYKYYDTHEVILPPA